MNEYQQQIAELSGEVAEAEKEVDKIEGGGGPQDNTELLKCHQDVKDLENDLERAERKLQTAQSYASRIESGYNSVNNIVLKLKRNAFPGKDGSKKKELNDKLREIKDNAVRIQSQ